MDANHATFAPCILQQLGFGTTVVHAVLRRALCAGRDRNLLSQVLHKSRKCRELSTASCMWAAACWLLLLVWQWAANKRQQSLTRDELREAYGKLLASRNQGSALQAQLAALRTQVSQLKDDKVIRILQK